MLNLSDNELDRLSREAAERHEAAQHPDAWNRMQKRLDEELGRPSPVQKMIKARRFLYYPAALILVTGIYFIIKPLTHTTTSTFKNSRPASPYVTPAPGKMRTRDSVTHIIISDESAGIAKQPTLKKAVRIYDPKGVQVVKSSSRKTELKPGFDSAAHVAGLKRSIAKSGKSVRTDVSPRQNNQVLKNKDEKQPSLNTDDPASSPVIKESFVAMNPRDDPAINKTNNNRSAKTKGRKTYPENYGSGQPVIAKNNAVEHELETASVNGIQPVASFPEYAFAGETRMQKNALDGIPGLPGNRGTSRSLSLDRSLQIGLVVSPDVSSVSSDYTSRVGSNIGLTLGYYLSSRFSVNTGLIFTRKFYTSNGQEFHAPPNFWTNMVRLDFVKGNCRMLEIPLNIRYDFRETGKTMFFASTGLSSYFMQKEKYQFYYHDNFTAFGRIQNSDYQTRQQYWLSVLNLSAGFETRISTRFSLQAEPYVKLPLTGIGFGKVQLNSYGMNLSLKYSPVLKRTRR